MKITLGEQEELPINKIELVRNTWFKKEFKPLFKKILKGYRFLGAFVERKKNVLYYDFRFDTPNEDELNLEIDRETGKITHVMMNGNVNLFSKEDLENGHVSEFKEIILTFKNHIERDKKKIRISLSELKKLIKEEVQEEEQSMLTKVEKIYKAIIDNKDDLSKVFIIENDKVKRETDGLPIIKDEVL